MGEMIIEAGDRPTFSTLLIEGMAGRMALLSSGARQFTELVLPGDFVDLHSLVMKRVNQGVLAFTDGSIGLLPHDALRRLMADDLHLARLLWLETVVDGAVHRTWLVGLGRKDATARMAHLFCETHARLDAVELVKDGRFPFPLSQTELADMLGLSPVHVNRTLMGLRGAGLIEWRDKILEIRDLGRLTRLAEFDPAYLRLWKEPV